MKTSERAASSGEGLISEGLGGRYGKIGAWCAASSQPSDQETAAAIVDVDDVARKESSNRAVTLPADAQVFDRPCFPAIVPELY